MDDIDWCKYVTRSKLLVEKLEHNMLTLNICTNHQVLKTKKSSV